MDIAPHVGHYADANCTVHRQEALRTSLTRLSAPLMPRRVYVAGMDTYLSKLVKLQELSVLGFSVEHALPAVITPCQNCKKRRD